MVALIISEIELQIRCQNHCKKSLFDSLLMKFSKRVMLSNTKKDEQRNMQRHCRGKILAVGGNSSPLSYIYINPLCHGVRYFPAFYFLEYEIVMVAASCNSDEVSDKTMPGSKRAPECGQEKLE